MELKAAVITFVMLSVLLAAVSGCAGPAPKYDLTIETEPPYLCAVYINGIAERHCVGDAPVTVSLGPGAHQVYLLIAPGEWGLGTWENGSTENPREIDLQSDKTITMHLVHLWEYVEIPINFEGARNLGSLHVELAYDPTVLEAAYTEAGWMEEGWLGNFASSEVDLEPGRVIITMASAGGINGDGSLEKISFEILAEEGTTDLTLQNVEARDATTGAEIPTEVSQGNFVAEDCSFTAPVIIFTH